MMFFIPYDLSHLFTAFQCCQEDTVRHGIRSVEFNIIGCILLTVQYIISIQIPLFQGIFHCQHYFGPNGLQKFHIPEILEIPVDTNNTSKFSITGRNHCIPFLIKYGKHSCRHASCLICFSQKFYITHGFFKIREQKSNRLCIIPYMRHTTVTAAYVVTYSFKSGKGSVFQPET